MSLCVVVVIFNIENSPIKRYRFDTGSLASIGIDTLRVKHIYG
jgi:hypothetical protein